MASQSYGLVKAMKQKNNEILNLLNGAAIKAMKLHSRKMQVSVTK